MALGPMDIVVIRFPGNNFTGQIELALKQAVDAGIVRIVDVLFFAKDADGTPMVFEITALDDVAYHGWSPVIDDISGLLSEGDALALAHLLEPNSAAVLLLVEHAWAEQLVTAIRDADGELLLSERIPRAVVDRLEADIDDIPAA